LYGFFRAAVVLCGSALESNLRNAIGPNGVTRVDLRTRTEEGRGRGFFDCLVDEADSQGALGKRVRPGEEPELVTYSRRVFDARTNVVHKGSAPTSTVAEELLTKSREVIDFIRSASQGNVSHEA
jgi:hypothetical protein